MGPIRQEVLSGIPDPVQFETTRRHLATFADLPINTSDYEEAARLFNVCRSAGVQGSHIDFLICAVAIRNLVPVFTTDRDFEHYTRHIKVRLYEPRAK
jgi:predicted nucleic acid-binding protein